MARMVGTFLKEKSWEKQKVYLLSNGFEITVETNPHYGGHVVKVAKREITWHCSNGRPDVSGPLAFLRPWMTKEGLVLPKFKKD